jgi:small subunit ribosomal protein S18
MNSRRPSQRKDGPAKRGTKPGIVGQARLDYVDYKDVALLERCVSDRSKIRARRSSGNDIQQQREIERAVKNAREMALLPYAKRVETNVRSARAGGTREIGETE